MANNIFGIERRNLFLEHPMERTAKITILDGNAAGCHECAVEDWTGVAYRIPHALLRDGKTRKKYENAVPRLAQSGIYFLFGRTKEGEKSVYIGQAKRRTDKRTTEKNGVLFRVLQSHRTKKDPSIDDWDEVVMIVSIDERINPVKPYIDYLENRFYLMASSVDNYVVRNGSEPTVEDEKNSAFIEHTNTALIALGYYVLEPFPSDKVVGPLKTPNDRPEILDSCTLGDKEVELLTGRHIVRFKYLEHEQSVSSWADMFEQVVKMLHRVNKSVLASRAERDYVRGIHVSSSEGALRIAVKIDDRVYVEGNTSTRDKIRHLRQLFGLYNIKETDLTFFYRSKS